MPRSSCSTARSLKRSIPPCSSSFWKAWSQKKPQASSGETSAPEEADSAKSPAKKNRNHSRIKGLDDLETIEETVYPEAYELIGREVTEQLDYRPGRRLKLLTI